MAFNSFPFLLVFLPLVLAGFALAVRFGRRAAILWLLLASVVFYGWSEPWLVLWLAGSVVVNAGLGRVVRGTDARPAVQWLVLAAGITINAGTIAACRLLPLALPGVSFIAFTQIGFLLDQRGAPRAGWLNHALLVGFFPHLIAGPILRGAEVFDQFDVTLNHPLRGSNLAIGSGFFLIGLLKKGLLADPLGPMVAAGFERPEALTLGSGWTVALAWSFALYFDFSGYSDMAIGLARLFGVRFPSNFASPYKAQSVIEYWQRWHMTLTRFLMSAIYNPLALAVMRSRRARGWPTDRAAQRTPAGFLAMVLWPIGVTMGVAGLWHGGTAPYLVFGLLHAGFLGVNHAWRLRGPGAEWGGWPAALGRILLTYLCVLIGSVIFRAPDLSIAGSILAAMAGLHGLSALTPEPRAGLEALWLLGLALIIWGAPNSQQIMEDHAGWPRWRASIPWAAAAGCAATLGLLSLGGTREFVYFQF